MSRRGVMLDPGVRALDVSRDVEHARPPAPADLSAAMRAWCARRVSQSALAMRVGISASHLNQIVHGRARPSLELARRILAVSTRPRRACPPLFFQARQRDA